MRETVSERYRKTLPGSWARWERARRVIPGGITHDGRYLTPFPLYIERAAGPRKWDVDGREYIDYWMGHGALFLGHSHPALVEAVQRQVARGTHYGACHDLEVEWAEWITRLIPPRSSSDSRCPVPRRPTSRSVWRAPTRDGPRS